MGVLELQTSMTMRIAPLLATDVIVLRHTVERGTIGITVAEHLEGTEDGIRAVLARLPDVTVVVEGNLSIWKGLLFDSAMHYGRMMYSRQ